MPILQGMELQVILSDVARIMDLPFHDQQSFIQEEMQGNQNNPQQQQQQPQQQQQQQSGQQILAILDEEADGNKAGQIWSNHLSPGSDCSNPEVITDDTSTDMFAWSNEFKLAFTTAPISGVNNSKMVTSNNVAISRKRKICNQAEDGAPQVKIVPQQPQQQQQQQQQTQQQTQQQLQLQLLEEKMAKLREKSRKQDAGPRLGGWQVEDLEAELDASGLGLGVDLSTSTNSYNMSETLLALPSLTVFKQEAPSPSANNDGLPQQSPTSGVGEADSNSGVASQLHQLLQQHSNSAFSGNGVSSTAQAQRHQLDTSGSQAMVGSTTGSLSTVLSQNNSAVSSPVSSSSPSDGQQDNIDCRFQYVLAAATSIATKVNEETLTYLNQGQSYEIKLKKLGELSAYRGKILKSAIRICFHERRLQYMEREQMAAWQASRPGDRIVEVDVPLSYGLLDVVQDPQLLNTVEFLWDPTKEVGVYIKVNCISTEFTPKKHGGEKGVPFRIQVETFLQGESGLKRLHAAACQIKVFKLKGADRKHKQDREKILKRPPSEQEKFQPSYECTVLNDIPSDAIVVAHPVVPTVTSSVASAAAFSPSDSHVSNGRRLELRLLGKRVAVTLRRPSTRSNGDRRIVYYLKQRPGRTPIRRRGRLRTIAFVAQGRTSTTPTTGANLNPVSVAPKEESKPVVPSLVSLTPPAVNPVLPEHSALPSSQEVPLYLQPLASEASSQQTAQWLQTHRFGSYLRTFASFSGADLLRLSRDDLIQICGLPDGIRLYNALHSKTIAPRLTMYLCVEQSSVYHALYLDSLSCAEMAGKLALLLGVVPDQVREVYLQGPNGIHVLITDEVVRNFKDEAMFTIEILQDPSGEQYRLLLKPTPH